MPYLSRRGRIFYFRKRLPRALSARGSNPFLCLSLRTDFLLDAVRRASVLVPALEERERQMLKDTGHADVCPELSKSILQEFLRAELIRLIKFEEQIATQEEDALEARLEALEAENRQLRAAARKGDWTVVQEPLEQAAALMKAGEAESAVPVLGRKVAALKRQVNDVEAGLIEGDPLEQASHDILAQNDLPKLEEFARPPVLISEVWAKTLELHTATMKGNIDALAKKAIAFFGDVPITAVTKERQKEFFAWMSRLPKTHGKGHGRNRYTSDDLLPLESAFFSSLCSGFGPLSTVGDTPTG